MSIFHKTEETNYWPSISDMFLVFFVIALASYAIVKGGGDSYIKEEAIEEGNVLFHRMGLAEYKGETKSAELPGFAEKIIEAYDAIDATGKLPAREFDGLTDEEKECIRKACGFDTADGQVGIQQLKEKAKKDYSLAISLLAWRCLYLTDNHYSRWRQMMNPAPDQDSDKGPKEPCERMEYILESQLRNHDILRHINACLAGQGIGNTKEDVPVLQQNIANLQSELDKYRNYIASWNKRVYDALDGNGKREVDAEKLQKGVNDLADRYERFVKGNGTLAEDNKRLADEIERLKQQLDDAQERLLEYAGLDMDIHELAQILNVSEGDVSIKDLLPMLKDKAHKVVAVASDARVSQVVLNEKDVHFVTAQTSFEKPEDAAKALDATVEKIRESINPSKRYVIEIIGHTDMDGSGMDGKKGRKASFPEAVNTDFGNPKLGLQRAVVIKNELERRMGARDNITYRCYSASWLAPLNYMERYDENRRVEVLIRPEGDAL